MKLYLSGHRCLPPWQAPVHPAVAYHSQAFLPLPQTSPSNSAVGEGKQWGQSIKLPLGAGELPEKTAHDVFQQLLSRVMLGGAWVQDIGTQMAIWITAFYRVQRQRVMGFCR